MGEFADKRCCRKTDGFLQVLVVVLHKSELNSWTIRAEASSETSRDQVCRFAAERSGMGADNLTVKVDDILCLLESEREARRLR